MIGKQCGLWCPQFGYCNNRNCGKDCEGFIPMDSEDEDDDELETQVERMTY